MGLRSTPIKMFDLPQGINIPSGATATIIANANIGNLNAAGATINMIAPSAGNTISANDNWALNGSPAAVNLVLQRVVF